MKSGNCSAQDTRRQRCRSVGRSDVALPSRQELEVLAFDRRLECLSILDAASPKNERNLRGVVMQSTQIDARIDPRAAVARRVTDSRISDDERTNERTDRRREEGGFVYPTDDTGTVQGTKRDETVR